MTIGQRIKSLRQNLSITQEELAKEIGTTKQNIYKYENEIITNIPSDKIEALAKIFNVTPAYLMGWESEIEDKETENYYLNPETRKLAQEIYENPDLRILFDASRNLSPEDINMVTNMIKRFKKDDDF